MKTVLTFSLMLFFFSAYSQDTLKINQINALVSGINSSNLPVQQDTLIQNHPELGLTMITYLTTIVNDGKLIKYVNHVNTTMMENGVTRKMITSSTFYYNLNKLIKVEEYVIEGKNKITADWYYSDDKPLPQLFQSDKAQERATFLLTLSKKMLTQVIK